MSAVAECRRILGDPHGACADAALVRRCSDMLGVLLEATRGLCGRARGEQTAVAKFELVTGTEALFGGAEALLRAARALKSDVDDVGKRLSALRRSAGFRKLAGDVTHGVVVGDDVAWVMLPLLHELVGLLEELEALLR